MKTNLLVIPGIGVYERAKIVTGDNYETAYSEAKKQADRVMGGIRKINDDEKIAALKLGATEIKI